MSERFIVETSARHLHVTEEDLETLFGKGAKLHYKKELSSTPARSASTWSAPRRR